MRQEAAVSVTGAVAARRRAGGTLGLEGLPGERRPVQKPLLLTACCQRTAVGTAVGGVLPTDVAQTVTARNWTPAGGGGVSSEGPNKGGSSVALSPQQLRVFFVVLGRRCFDPTFLGSRTPGQTGRRSKVSDVSAERDSSSGLTGG